MSLAPLTPPTADSPPRDWVAEFLPPPGKLLERVMERAAQWNSTLKPMDGYEMNVVEQMSYVSLRLDVTIVADDNLRLQRARQAEHCWDDDRAREAEEAALKLPTQPGLTVRKLRRTPHGCVWLIGRWSGLLRYLERHPTWHRPQRNLALDLLGVPAELRDADDRVHDRASRDELLAVARAQVAELEALRTGPAALRDGAERAEAIAGLGLERTAAGRLLRRDESSCRRALMWYRGQLRASQPPPRRGPRGDFGLRNSDCGPGPEPPASRPSPPPAPARASAPSPTPPPAPSVPQSAIRNPQSVRLTDALAPPGRPNRAARRALADRDRRAA